MKIKKFDPARLYLLTQLVAGTSNWLVFTTSIVYRMDVVGLDALQLVLVGTTLEVTAFLFEIPTGVVADIYSRRLSVIIGMFVIGFGFMLEGFAPLFWVVLLAQVGWGLGWTFISGAHSAWITDEIGVEQVGPVFLRGRQFMMAGNVIGSLLAVWLARVSLAWPFIAGGALRMLFAVFLVFFMPETGFQRAEPGERADWRQMWGVVRTGVDLVRARRALLIFALIGLFVGLYSEGWDRLNRAHLLANFTFPSVFGFDFGVVEWFGVISLVWNLVGMAANGVARRRVNTVGSQPLARSLQGLYAVMVLALVAFALTGHFWVALAVKLVFDTARSVTFPLSEAFVNQFIDSKVRATVLSMTSQVDALGQMAGGPLIGAVGRWFSLPAAMLTAAGILLPTIPLYGRLRRDTTAADDL